MFMRALRVSVTLSWTKFIEICIQNSLKTLGIGLIFVDALTAELTMVNRSSPDSKPVKTNAKGINSL